MMRRLPGAARLLLASGAAALLVAGCAPTPVLQPPPTERVGSEAAEAPGAPRPLRALQRHRPVPADAPLSEVVTVEAEPAPAFEEPKEIDRGGASYYGLRFHGRRTASGERFDMAGMTAAHRTLPFGTMVCVRSLVNGKTVMVRINDRGPHARQRVIDLSQGAADALGMLGLGIKQVAISVPPAGQERCTEVE